MKDERAVVAAVPYRRRGGRLEFLLVRTKGGRRWTFPKGHVKRREAPAAAAAREAREEAGVVGSTRRTPFAAFLYPARARPGDDDAVAVYLLRVKAQRPPAEKFRQPRWLAPREAARLLGAGNRERRYARQLRRVLAEAQTTLSRRRAATSSFE